jgi:hypothetical protein
MASLSGSSPGFWYAQFERDKAILLVTARKHPIQGANPSLLITHLAWHTGTRAQKKQPPKAQNNV